VEKKTDPRLLALKADQQALQELWDSQGWAVVVGLVQQIQRQATSVLKKDKEPQALFQAQGVLRAFEEMSSSIEILKDANEDVLAMMIPKEE